MGRAEQREFYIDRNNCFRVEPTVLERELARLEGEALLRVFAEERKGKLLRWDPQMDRTRMTI